MDVINIAQDYLKEDGASHPLFVAFDASADLSLLVSSLSSCKKVRVSDFCHAPDALPDLDALGDRIRQMSGKAVLLGIGDYAALSGDKEIVRWIFGLPLHNLRLVVPVWMGHGFIEDMSSHDPRILGRRGISFPKTEKHWSIRIFREGLVKNPNATGFQTLMRILEDGCDNAITAITEVVPLNTVWCRRIGSAYEVYKERHPQSAVPETMFTERQWTEFLNEERTHDDSLASADSLLRFLEEGTADDPYLAFVVSKTRQHSEWGRNLLRAILDVSVDDDRFGRLYDARKKIIARFDKTEMAEFLRESRCIADPSVRIRYMTDCTAMEREEIMRLFVDAESIPASVENVYPALWNYWRKFSFWGDEFAVTLTKYFQDYKRQKLLGRIETDFMETVCVYAEDRPQFTLPTRESVLESIGTDGVALCWLDSLGCEFLSFIQVVADNLGLKLKISPARVKLPSITSVNRSFYDEWMGEKMPPVSKLDKIKHGEFERCSEQSVSELDEVKQDNDGGEKSNNKLVDAAIELPHELMVVEETIKAIAGRLRKKPGSKVVLTSDHGATRLAVISRAETVWEMPEKGKHGGRCCRKSEFDGVLPSCVTESDDEKWHVLAGYDRFKGGRKGDVEVHGGATLEEMVVPVIEFELLDKNVRVSLAKNQFKVTFRDTEITLQLFCASSLMSPSVVIDGIRYKAVADGNDTGRYFVRIPKPAAGEYEAVVYEGDTRIDVVRFSVISGGAQIKKDDFF